MIRLKIGISGFLILLLSLNLPAVIGQDASSSSSKFGTGGGFTRFPQRSLESMLNQVDGSFQSAPPAAQPSGQFSSAAPGMYPQRAPAGAYKAGYVPNQSRTGYNTGLSPAGGQSPWMRPGGASGMASSSQAGSGMSYPQSGSLMNAFAPVGGMHQPLQSGPPPFSKQNLLRIFFGGGSGSGFGGSSGGDSSQNQAKDASIVGQAEALLQRARNQAAQAESDAERARNGDRGSRLSAASSAQYHANDARSAADTAASITYGASQYAQDYAAQARDAANRAQSAADRANYNANI